MRHFPNINDEQIQIVHQAEENRFVVEEDNISAYIEYEPRKSDLWIITELQVQKSRKQSIIGNKLIASLLSYASSRNKRVIPLSTRVKGLFEQNASFTEHLYRG